MTTIKSIFKNGKLLNGEKIMFETYQGENFTFSQFASKVKDIQNTLYYYRITKGDKVAILAEDTPQWNMAFYAITTMGAIAVPIPKYKDASIIHRITLEAECNHLLLQKDIINDATFAKLREDTHLTIIDIDTLRCILYSNYQQKQQFAYDNVNSLTMPWVDLSETDLAAAKVDIDPYSVNITYYTHEELIVDAKEQAAYTGITEKDVIVSIMPISYSFKKVTTALISVISGNLTVFKPKHANFKTILSLITDIKPTVIFTVPKVLDLVYKSSMVNDKSKALIETNVEKIRYFDRLRLKIQGSKIYKTLGGKVRVCNLEDDQPKNKRVEKFLKYSGLNFKMKFS
ncbi:long-chain fatty acid--CoA ligase [Odoribacter sp. OttesenSCG-928-L07]|nr:long-chain fatty acid--CoA ligase [Odoribacter sp. OttesenSCG-928-L07]MDL2239336.1 long-chain fatty acid--CoA ligase [Bacteroidales bacterium OttesenSCG-928-L14]MDL2240381.1 long-chain fatty acid--CoA ligase [Bacteroidales bacterium OttesenSCG-928-K22]